MTPDISQTLRTALERTNQGDSSKLNAQQMEEAGREFEALLVAQMFKSFREAGSGGWLGSGGGQAESATIELAEAELARAMAQRGVFGIAELLASSRALNTSEAPEPSPQASGQPTESAPALEKPVAIATPPDAESVPPLAPSKTKTEW